LAWYGKAKPNSLIQQKHTFTNQKKCTATQHKHKKIKVGLVASYDIRPGNGDGLFWFWRFINLSLTYLLRHLPTYLQARDPHEANLNNKQLLGLFTCVRIALCTNVAHNTAQNRPANFPSYLPDNHHCSDDVYSREGATNSVKSLKNTSIVFSIGSKSTSCQKVLTVSVDGHGIKCYYKEIKNVICKTMI